MTENENLECKVEDGYHRDMPGEWDQTLTKAEEYRGLARRALYNGLQDEPGEGSIAAAEYNEKARYLELLARYDGWLFD